MANRISNSNKGTGDEDMNSHKSLMIIESLTAKVQKKKLDGIKLSFSDKIFQLLTGKESKMTSHHDFVQEYLINNDDITTNQKELLDGLTNKFPHKAAQKNVLLSKGGILSKHIRQKEGAGGVVHIEKKDRNERNIVINGNFKNGTEQFLYVHESMHHFLDRLSYNKEISKLLTPILAKVNQTYEKDTGTYDTILKNMIEKYPQYSYYFQNMGFHAGLDIDELVAEAYSNPVFREYLKSIQLDTNTNILQKINDIMNTHFQVTFFK